MKQITLTKGMFALVDNDDYEYLNQFKWQVFKTPYTYYASRAIWINQKVIHILMHRDIMNTPIGMVCDHAFHNGLDNRKFIEIDDILKPNLRNCSSSDNQRNKKPIGKSKYMGVYFNNLNGKKISIQAAITINKKTFDKSTSINITN